jgi:hypothetical protein
MAMSSSSSNGEEGAKWVKASEVLARLRSDPEYQRKMTERAEQRSERRERMANLQKPVLEDLAAIGITSQSLRDVIESHAPLSQKIIRVLLKHLELADDDTLRESIIRALTAADEPFDGSSLGMLFRKSWSENVRFVILNLIAVVRPHSVDDFVAWLKAERPVYYDELDGLGYGRASREKRRRG